MIVNYENLPEIREEHAQSKIVLVGGVFDLLHVGHVRGLRYCKTFGDILTVGVVSDERTRQRKGPNRPVVPEQERLELIASLSVVNYAFIMPLPSAEETPTVQAIKKLRPDIFMDHVENASHWLPYIDDIESLGVKFEFNHSPRPESSTNIIDRIIELHENSAVNPTLATE